MLHSSVPVVTASKLVLLCDVPCLNPGLDIGCPNMFCGFPQSLKIKNVSILPQIGQKCIVLQPVQFTVH
jgi:hypothetical protein